MCTKHEHNKHNHDGHKHDHDGHKHDHAGHNEHSHAGHTAIKQHSNHTMQSSVKPTHTKDNTYNAWFLIIFAIVGIVGIIQTVMSLKSNN